MNWLRREHARRWVSHTRDRKKTCVTKISEPEVKDEVTTQTFKQPSVGWVSRCLLEGVSFVVAVSTHTLMSSTMALTYTHPAHNCSSHYPLRPLSFLPVTGEFYFKIIKNPLKSRLRNVMISFQAFQADTTGRHWGGHLEGGSQSSSAPPAGTSQSTVCIWCPVSHVSVCNGCLAFIFLWSQLRFKWHPSDHVWFDIYFISTITLFFCQV